jgi:hypothetical protein
MPFDCVKCWLSIPQKYTFDFVAGPNISDNRNTVVKNALEDNDHLLFIDSDILFTEEDVAKIEKHLNDGLDIITGVYVIGIDTFYPCIFDDKLRPIRDLEKLKEVYACGAGFLGISKTALRKIGEDAFLQVFKDGVRQGEDISFCNRLHELGIKIWCDPKIQLGHMRMIPITSKTEIYG